MAMVNIDMLMTAIEDMGKQFRTNEALGHLSCQEFRPVAEVFILAGFPALAADALISHGTGDYEDSDEHHDLYSSGIDQDEIAMSHVREIASQLGVDL